MDNEFSIYKADYSSGQSLREIAKKYDTYPNRVRKVLTDGGYPMRTLSDSQKNAIKRGVKKLPTEGRERTSEEKIKIAKAVRSAIEEKGEKYKKLLVKRGKKNWEAKSEREIKEFKKKGRAALHKASKEGSKMELYLRDRLISVGEDVRLHEDFVFNSEKMHIDLFLPKRNVCLEIDGPTHWRKVFTQKHFEKQKHYDLIKESFIKQNKMNLIRVRLETNGFALSKGELAYEKIMNEIQNLNGTGNTIVFSV